MISNYPMGSYGYSFSPLEESSMSFFKACLAFCFVATACCKPQPVEPIKPVGAKEEPKEEMKKKEEPKAELKTAGIPEKGMDAVKKLDKKEDKKEDKEKPGKEDKEKSKKEDKRDQKRAKISKQCRDDKGKFKKCNDEPKKKPSKK